MCIKENKKSIIYKALLKDNTPVFFNLVQPECKNCISKGLLKMSIKSRFYRFNSPINKFTDNELEYLTNVDNYNHLALGGCNPYLKESPGMGIARYIVTNQNLRKAEIAITVVDEYQNKGLGTLLLSLLIKYGIKNNISTFYGYILTENTAILKLFNKFSVKDVKTENYHIYREINLEKSIDIALKQLKKYKLKNTVFNF